MIKYQDVENIIKDRHTMIKIKKLRPMFTNLVTTMDSYEDDVILDSGLIDVSKQRGALKEYQTVIAVGNAVKDIHPGDVVCINPIRYAQYKQDKSSLKDLATDNPVIGYNFNVVEIDGKDCLLLHDQDIRYVIEEYEEIKDPVPSKIIQ